MEFSRQEEKSRNSNSGSQDVATLGIAIRVSIPVVGIDSDCKRGAAAEEQSGMLGRVL